MTAGPLIIQKYKLKFKGTTSDIFKYSVSNAGFVEEEMINKYVRRCLHMLSWNSPDEMMDELVLTVEDFAECEEELMDMHDWIREAITEEVEHTVEQNKFATLDIHTLCRIMGK